MVNGDGEHAGDRAGECDASTAGSKHRAIHRGSKVHPVVPRISPLGAVGRNHRSGHGSPQTKGQQQPHHHPSFGQALANVSEIGGAGKGFDCP
jgi:hypothetical protein